MSVTAVQRQFGMSEFIPGITAMSMVVLTLLRPASMWLLSLKQHS